MHRIVPMRGILQEARIPQVAPTPCWMDSASTIFVAENRAAPKKSAWTQWTSKTVKVRVRYTLVRGRRPWSKVVGWC